MAQSSRKFGIIPAMKQSADMNGKVGGGRGFSAISLFSCIGVGEFYLSELGIDVRVASDIDGKRCDVHRFLHPHTDVVCGDVTKPETRESIIEKAGGKVDLIISTPPCQGMSTVGKNRSTSSLLSSEDKRNDLILETFPFIDALDPSYVMFENVPRLLQTVLSYQDRSLCIGEILSERYGDRYNVKIDVFNTAEFGIPQNRERVFIRMHKHGLEWRDPPKSGKVVTLRDAIGDLPSIEPGQDSGLKNHWARKHPENQVVCMSHTPTGCTAFDNEEFYPRKKNGERVKGYHNCYKRVEWDKPAPTITMRNEIMSSQDNVHPGRLRADGLWSDARVFTIRELLIVMSMPPDLDFPDGVSDTSLRQYIGEGIPPLMAKKVLEGIC